METQGRHRPGQPGRPGFVPLTAYQTRLAPTRTVRGSYTVSTINVQVPTRRMTQAAVQDIGAVLRQRHRVTQDDFTIQSQEDFLATAPRSPAS